MTFGLILWLRFPSIPGGDIAGEVVAVGPGVIRFKPGDAVVAFVDLKRGGGYGELAAIKESAAALKPEAPSFAEAAPLPIAGVTALQALRDVGGLKEAGSVLLPRVPSPAEAGGNLRHDGARPGVLLLGCGPVGGRALRACEADKVPRGPTGGKR